MLAYLSNLYTESITNLIGIILGILALIFSFNHSHGTHNHKVQQSHLKQLYIIIVILSLSLILKNIDDVINTNYIQLSVIKNVIFCILGLYIHVRLIISLIYVGAELFYRKK